MQPQVLGSASVNSASPTVSLVARGDDTSSLASDVVLEGCWRVKVQPASHS